jgi:hypothetical protein
VNFNYLLFIVLGIFIGLLNFILWQLVMLFSFAFIIIMALFEIFNLKSLMNEKTEQKKYLNIKKGEEKENSLVAMNFVCVSFAAVSIILSIMSFKLVKGVEMVNIIYV